MPSRPCLCVSSRNFQIVLNSPVIVGQLFIAFGTSAIVLGWLGIALAVIGIAFHLINPAEENRTEEFA